MTLTAIKYPVAPRTEPLKGTLLNTATVTDDFEWLDGRALFPSYNCMTFQHVAPFCAPNSKTFDQAAAWQDGFRFAVYGGLDCGLVGGEIAEQFSEGKRVFTEGESIAVEQALMVNRFRVSAGTADAGVWSAPTDITPTTIPDAKHAVALLEGFAAQHYVGVPTIHIPRVIASLMTADETLVWDGGILRTKMGAKVAAGAGYDLTNTSPTGTSPAAGKHWLYATGEVWIGRGQAIEKQEPDKINNRTQMLIERPYIVGVDCFTAAVQTSNF